MPGRRPARIKGIPTITPVLLLKKTETWEAKRKEATKQSNQIVNCICKFKLLVVKTNKNLKATAIFLEREIQGYDLQKEKLVASDYFP